MRWLERRLAIANRNESKMILTLVEHWSPAICLDMITLKSSHIYTLEALLAILGYVVNICKIDSGKPSLVLARHMLRVMSSSG